MKQEEKIRLKTVFTWVIRVIIVQLVFINISAAFHASRFTHFYDDEHVRNLPSSKGRIFLRTWRLMVGRKFPKSRIQYKPPMPYDTVALHLADGKRIKAWYMKTESSRGTVILFHGLNSNKGDLLSEAEEFLGMDYNVFMPDTRAHGESDGRVNSLGVKESEEVKMAYEFIRSEGESNIILWGMSLGAVMISKAVYDYHLEPQKIILEMPFNRLQDHIRARARLAGFPDEPFAFLVTGWIGIEQGYWGYRHRTSRYVSRIKCPVLLQWGAKDEYVERHEIREIYAEIGSSEKSVETYEQCGHEPLLLCEPEKWREKVQAFLEAG